MKKPIKLAALFSASLLLASCGDATEGSVGETISSGEETIHLSTTPGPYSELFFEEIAPILEEQGYTVEETNFAEMRPANLALAEGSVNLNVDQNKYFMENFNEEAGADFTAVAPIPTLPSSLYPANKTSLEEVEAGDSVGVPNDPANLTRALLILEKIDWISLDMSQGFSSIDLESIEENHAGIEIIPMQSSSIPPALPDLSYAVIPGAVMYDAGIDSDSALAQEEVLPDIYLHIVVNSQDEEEEWVEDVAEAYRSEEFLSTMEEINNNPDELNWVLPDYDE